MRDFSKIRSSKKIVAHANKLDGTTLSGLYPQKTWKKAKGKNKGEFGNFVQSVHFGIPLNNDKGADFRSAKIELKVSPLVETKHGASVKERLKLSKLNYFDVMKERWTTCSLMVKNRQLLLVFYWYTRGASPWKLKVLDTKLWKFPEAHLGLIKRDWDFIRAKIARGDADGLSDGDTLLLAATTSGSGKGKLVKQPASDKGARPRSFTLRRPYIQFIFDHLHGRYPAASVKQVVSAARVKKKSFEEIISSAFQPFVGLTRSKVIKKLKLNPKAKHVLHLASVQMLDAKDKKIEEFESAGVIMRTLRLRKNGVPKEAVSFPRFDFEKLVQEKDWYGSSLREELSRKFLFVIYRWDKNKKDYVFIGVRFWNMPLSDLDKKARAAWKKAVAAVSANRKSMLPKISDDLNIHVRPHGRRASDTKRTPAGSRWTKRSFWLNASYIAQSALA